MGVSELVRDKDKEYQWICAIVLICTKEWFVSDNMGEKSKTRKEERKKRSQKSINIFAFVIFEYQKDKFESLVQKRKKWRFFIKNCQTRKWDCFFLLLFFLSFFSFQIVFKVSFYCLFFGLKFELDRVKMSHVSKYETCSLRQQLKKEDRRNTSWAAKLWIGRCLGLS